MAKKIIPIYTYIDSYLAERTAMAISDAERFGDELEIRISTGGGDVEQGWALLSLIQSFKGVKTMQVDGRAMSMGAFMCLYAENVEALNVSSFMLHRASYGKWIESSEYFTEDMKKNLDMVNSNLKAKMKQKIDADAFKKAFNITIDEMFEGEQKDYSFDAKTAKKIGLISSIKTLDSVAKSDINAICRTVEIAAMYDEQTESKTEQLNSHKMTIQEVKANHPDVVKAIQDETIANVKAWQGFIDIDAKTALEGMVTGNAPTAAEIATMQANYIKAQGAGATETVPAGATAETTTEEIPPAGAAPEATSEANEENSNPYMAGIDAMFAKESKK